MHSYTRTEHNVTESKEARKVALGRNGVVTLLIVLFAVGTADAQSSMFSDFKARQVGDIITIRLLERTSAQRSSEWENQSTAQRGGEANVAGGNSLSGRFALDSRFNNEAQNRNESVQSDLLNGTMTAVIVGRDSTGLLIVNGERKLSVNGETHLMKVNGLVRGYDIRPDNTIPSYQIANASIEYRRDGLRHKMFKPGAFARIGSLLAIGAAVFYATQ